MNQTITACPTCERRVYAYALCDDDSANHLCPLCHWEHHENRSAA